MSSPLSIVRGPLNHYDVLDTDRCHCAVCDPWFRGRVEVARMIADRPDHPPTCNCVACQPARRARFQFQAINTRRDLWIEASYHASLHRYGPSYMEWLAAEMGNTKLSTGWWANEASRHPLHYWFERFETAVQTGVVAITGAISGVFRFVSYYLEVEPEGGGYASTSSLNTDEIVRVGINENEGVGEAYQAEFRGYKQVYSPNAKVLVNRSSVFVKATKAV